MNERLVLSDNTSRLEIRMARAGRRCIGGCLIARHAEYVALAGDGRSPSYCAACCVRWGSARLEPAAG